MTDESGAERLAGPEGEHSHTERLWTRPFVLICSSHFLSYANQNMLMPILPLYLVAIGHTPAFVGLTILAFNGASLVTRPWLGYSVDRWSARGTNSLGGLMLGVASFFLTVPSMAVYLTSRAVGGIGWAGINTAGSAMAANQAPPERRGEALSYFTITSSLAKTLMPALGLWLAEVAGFSWVFILAGLLGLGAMSTSAMIPARPTSRSRRREGGPLTGLLDRNLLVPTLLSFLLNTGVPITGAFIVLYAAERGIGDLWLFFVVGGIAAIGTRLLGRLSDRWGRMTILSLGFLLSIASLLTMMWSTTLAPLLVGGVLWASGQALANPAALAMVTDRSTPERRGAAMATYTAAFPMGIGLGGLIWGVVIENWGFRAMFLGATAVLVVGVLVIGTTMARKLTFESP